jgi:heterotetrameric sarcosine oxidase gamma subunit
VADFEWTTHAPLQHVLVPGRYGASTGHAGVRLTDVRAFTLVQIMARRGQWNAAANAATACFGTEAPDRPKAVASRNAILLWSGPKQFLALAPQAGDIGYLQTLRQTFASLASISNQSDARAFVRITGNRARDMLAKLSSLDLADTTFPVGRAAATSIDHTSVNLWRAADTPAGVAVFNILILASFADSLWRTFLNAGAEYGVDVVQTESVFSQPAS